ncbi:MAG: AAA family ATPase, partial [Firmicutes bacterium]|nr:AAA family ATPase [Bacillota bacterium]
IKAKLIYPETKGDFNDLHCEKKLEAFLKKNKQRFIIYDLEKFMNLELPPDEMVIDPIMPVGGIMLLYAKPGVGKSMVTLSIAHGIASGTNALCWNMPKPRCVLYVDGEMDGRDVQRRLRNFIAGSGIEFNPENFRYLNLRLQEKENQSPDFSAKIIQNAIEEELKGVDVLILDNLSTLTKCKENDSDEWVRMQDWLLGLRSKRVSTIVVHHAGKLGSQRGTSRKEDVMDTVIALKKETEGGGSGFKVKIEYDKCRGFGGANANPFVATLIELPNKGVKWAVNQEKRDERDIVRELFSIGMNVKDITEETGLSKATIYRIKKEYNNGK